MSRDFLTVPRLSGGDVTVARAAHRESNRRSQSFRQSAHTAGIAKIASAAVVTDRDFTIPSTSSVGTSAEREFQMARRGNRTSSRFGHPSGGSNLAGCLHLNQEPDSIALPARAKIAANDRYRSSFAPPSWQRMADNSSVVLSRRSGWHDGVTGRLIRNPRNKLPRLAPVGGLCAQGLPSWPSAFAAVKNNRHSCLPVTR